MAAALFGLTTPLVKHFGVHAGPFATATLLYAGAALGAGVPRRRVDEAIVTRAQAPRMAVVALFGSVLAPAALAWGLQRSGALAGSLLLEIDAGCSPLGLRRAAASRCVAGPGLAHRALGMRSVGLRPELAPVPAGATLLGSGANGLAIRAGSIFGSCRRLSARGSWRRGARQSSTTTRTVLTCTIATAMIETSLQKSPNGARSSPRQA